MPLKELRCDFDPKRDTQILRSIRTLGKINRLPVNPAVFNTTEGLARPDLEEVYEMTKTALTIEFSDEEAARLRALLEPHGRDARTVAEFGIGTNDRAIVTGVILEDEKVMGTIHIAFGDNKSMGGSVRVASHLDGLVTRPSVWFDDRPIMKDGRLLVD